MAKNRGRQAQTEPDEQDDDESSQSEGSVKRKRRPIEIIFQLLKEDGTIEDLGLRLANKVAAKLIKAFLNESGLYEGTVRTVTQAIDVD